MDDLIEPKSAAIRAHCRRVAAWALELGAALKLSKADLAILTAAAEAHHTPSIVIDENGRCRLADDLRLKSPIPGTARVENIEVERVLEAVAFPHPDRFPESVLRLAEILDLANYFDEQLEIAPLEGSNLDRVFDAVVKAARSGPWDPSLVVALGSLRKVVPAEVVALIPKLPIYPAIAIRAVNAASKPDASLSDFEAVCMQDPVLTGLILETANSAKYSPRFPITNVAQAANYIGLEATRRVLAAAAMKPLFASARLRALWKHSLECAHLAETIAQLAGTVDPREAFVMGMLHDIGRLVFSLLPRDVGDSCDRLITGGCEPLLAEMVLTGYDHAQAGSQVLGHWRLPKSLIEGVRYHHQPEDSDGDLASLLYLTEFWAADDEDLPSNRRLSYALKRLKISPELLDTANLARLGALETVLT